MFLMTFPPYSLEVRHVAKVVKEKSGSLFLFTDSAACPVYSEADKVIRCITNSLLLTNSFAGLISILHKRCKWCIWTKRKAPPSEPAENYIDAGKRVFSYQ